MRFFLGLLLALSTAFATFDAVLPTRHGNPVAANEVAEESVSSTRIPSRYLKSLLPSVNHETLQYFYLNRSRSFVDSPKSNDAVVKYVFDFGRLNSIQNVNAVNHKFKEDIKALNLLVESGVPFKVTCCNEYRQLLSSGTKVRRHPKTKTKICNDYQELSRINATIYVADIPVSTVVEFNDAVLARRLLLSFAIGYQQQNVTQYFISSSCIDSRRYTNLSSNILGKEHLAMALYTMDEELFTTLFWLYLKSPIGDPKTSLKLELSFRRKNDDMLLWVLSKYEPSPQALDLMLSHLVLQQQYLEEAIKYGRFNTTVRLMKKFKAQNRRLRLREIFMDCLSVAARFGQTEILRTLLQEVELEEIDNSRRTDILNRAIESELLPIVQLVFESLPLLTEYYLLFIPWGPDYQPFVVYALERSSVEVIEYLMNKTGITLGMDPANLRSVLLY